MAGHLGSASETGPERAWGSAGVVVGCAGSAGAGKGCTEGWGTTAPKGANLMNVATLRHP